MRGQQSKGKQPPQKIKNELTEEQKREIKEAFSSFEEGGLMPDELKLAMKALGFDPRNEDVQKIMQKVENQGNKPIRYDQFMDIMIEKPDNEPEVEMRKAFKILCEDGTDKITLKSLKKICADLGENITDEELNEMITEADKDQDEVIISFISFSSSDFFDFNNESSKQSSLSIISLSSSSYSFISPSFFPSFFPSFLSPLAFLHNIVFP